MSEFTFPSERPWSTLRTLMRMNLAAASRDTGERRDSLASEDRRKVVIREAPANMDWATGTPRYSSPAKMPGSNIPKNPTLDTSLLIAPEMFSARLVKMPSLFS